MMTARSRGQNQDWDLEYDNSNYDPQNPDDSSSGYVNLDHCRLYITNIPRALNDDGLTAAFSKYGNLTEYYVNSDPDKRYGLISFETPGEAKAAMMKLNRTEPLNLYVSIAHKSKSKKVDKSGYRGGNSSGARYHDDRGFRDDGSTGNRSNSRRQDFMANGDSMDDLVGDHGILNSCIEPDVNLELEQLKLQHLKLQEEQLLCKQRMLLLKQAERKPSSSTRCIMPDGRIVVRSVDQGENDADGNYGAGAGDARNQRWLQNKIPGLQSCGACVACGERAEAFCSGCRVTPYCSAACQRRDWGGRHKRVCHNLRRQSGDAVASRPVPEPEPIIPALAPLRRPRSPDSARRDSGSDRMPPRKFGPPGMATTPTPVASAAARGGPPARASPAQADRGRPQRSYDGDNDKSNARPNDRDRNQDNRNSGRKNTDYDRPRNQNGGNRQFPRPSGSANKRAEEQDEDWGPAPAQKPQESKPVQVKSPPAQVPAAAAEVKPRPKPVEAEVKPRPKPVEAAPVPGPSARPLATVADVAPMPVRRLTPNNCVAELLSVDDQFLVSVDATGESCRTGPGWVCTVGVPSGQHADDYGKLLEPLAEACEAAEACQPRPGDLFAYLDASEAAWYRARCLAPGLAALLDASRLVPLSSQDRCSRLPKDFADIPEYCCHLESSKVKLGDTLEGTVVSKSGGKLTVTLATEGAPVGTAAVRRWLPEVDLPAAAATATATATAPVSTDPSQVPRPTVRNNSVVVLLHATEPSRVLIRPADAKREFDDLGCQVECYAADAAVPRLTELPVQGQTVIARFTDGVHYRAFVKRVSSKLKRCLLEYIEYGNVEIEENLENLCACPPELDLNARPTLTSMVALQMNQKNFTDPAKEYLDTIKEDVELKLTIPSGAESGPTGTPVRLTIVKSGEDVNRKVETLCTPEWQRLLERGGDVLDMESVHFSDVEYVDLPPSGELEIIDSGMLASGTVYGHARQAPHAQRAFALAPRLEEYCNSALARDPYLPKLEELCVARCPKRKQWVRAVLLDQAGPGSLTGDMLLVDYGELTTLPVSALRKMPAEFVRGLPAACCCLEIRDFPPNPTEEQLEQARRHMQIRDQGAGTLKFTRCTRQDVGEYCVEAPDLIRAIQ